MEGTVQAEEGLVRFLLFSFFSYGVIFLSFKRSFKDNSSRLLILTIKISL